MLFRLISLLVFLVSLGRAVDVTVKLPYATYRGIAPADGVSEWHGMRYAAPPLGALRFAPPQDPPSESGVQDASTYKPYCLAVGDKPPVNTNTSEDCLYTDVFAPTTANQSSKLPVFVFIQGGGFASNANSDLNGRGLVTASNHSIVVVTFNYRVGPYGFIAGSQVSSPNNGLKDQRKLLKWVKKYIYHFGGDPDHVVIGGDSAGAASVSMLLTANGGHDDQLFIGAAAESVSFATVLTIDESQYQYDTLVKNANCSAAVDSLSCLRNLTSNQLQTINEPTPFPNGPGGVPLYSWNPVIDGSLIPDYTYRAFNSGSFIKVPVIFGDDTNGGTIFAPSTTNTLNESNTFLRNQFPYLTASQISTLNELYPNPNITFPDAPDAGKYWRQLANVYGEMRYTCPGIFISAAYERYGQGATYNYLYNVVDKAQNNSGDGVPHTVEVNAIFGPGNLGAASPPASYLPGGDNAEIVPIIQAYWVSFIKSLNPNTYRLTGQARWDAWRSNKAERLTYNGPAPSTKMEMVDEGIAGQLGRCEYLWSIGLAIRQ